MKKVIFSLLFLIPFSFCFSQVYQLPNGGFEDWEGSGDNAEPVKWSSFKTSQCDLSIGCSMAQVKKLDKSSDVRPGSNGEFSCRIYATSIMGVIANGNVTTGKIRVGSTSATSDQNYNFTQRSDDNFSQKFDGRPDSLIFWAKFSCNSSSQEASFATIIHDDYDYRDPQSSDGNAGNHVVGKATQLFNKGNGDWKRYSVPFSYGYSATTPKYILISATTNKTGGAGATSDALFIDDIEFIYNCKISDLKINGIRITGFNPQITEYNITAQCGVNYNISAIALSSSATVNVVQANETNNFTATITILNGNQSKQFFVHFIYNTYSSTENITICEGSSYQLGDEILTTAGIYTKVFTAVNGCDSTITINLSIGENYERTIQATICIGELYNENGFQENATGLYSIIIPSSESCDTIVYLQLIVNEIEESTINAALCEGNEFIFNGESFSEPGTYEIFDNSENNCKKVFLHLETTANSEITLYDTIWAGAQYFKDGFSIFETDTVGTLEYNIRDSANCLDKTLFLTIKRFVREPLPTSSDFVFKYYPNPAKQYFIIEIEEYEADDLEYYLYNSQGSLVSSGRIIGNKYQVNTSNLRCGIYSLKLFLSEEHYKTEKLIIR
ncbi:MAG: T9SS type A sorting domain-containing protein [Bacteroidales bacterium]|jgi:hypothetical protein|nr:T9SS type A sorting domain-containing protein [Bacteroidales bacterium]